MVSNKKAVVNVQNVVKPIKYDFGKAGLIKA